MARFPYTNFHDLNLDWVLAVMKSFDDMSVKVTGGKLSLDMSIDDDWNRTLTLKAPFYYPPNLLDNSLFTDPVNQLGKTLYTASANPATQFDTSSICIDRWRLGANSQMTVNENGIVVEGNIYQIMDDIPSTSTLIFSDGETVNYTIASFNTAPSKDRACGGIVDGHAVVNLPSGNYEWVALLPEIITDYQYQKKDRITELYNAYRHMYAVPYVITGTTYNPLWFGYGVKKGRALIHINTPVEIEHPVFRNNTLIVNGQSIRANLYSRNKNMLIANTYDLGLTEYEIVSAGVSSDFVVDGEPIITF